MAQPDLRSQLEGARASVEPKAPAEHLVKQDGSEYTNAEIVSYFDAALPKYANNHYKVGPQDYASREKLLDEWKKIRQSVPQDLQDALTRSTSAPGEGVYSAVARVD